MTGIDRRQFVVSLSAAVAGAALVSSCRRIDPTGMPPELAGLFGKHEAWDQLGGYWLQQSGEERGQVLVALADRLGWRSEMAAEDLVAAILRAMREDFESGRIDGPDDWGLAETELRIYAALTNPATATGDSEPQTAAG